MHRSTSRLAGFLAILLVLSGHARAMSFLDFAKMNDDDESTYVAELIEGSVQYLRAHGQPDQAAKVLALFKSSGPNSGTRQMVDQAKRLNALNSKNATNPNNRAPVYDVEDAMAATLKNSDVVIPMNDLRAINAHFRPAGLSRKQMSQQQAPSP